MNTKHFNSGVKPLATTLQVTLCTLTFLLPGLSTASGQLVSNGSFEAPVLNSAEPRLFATGATVGGGWTVLGSAGNSAAVFVLQTEYAEPDLGVNQFNAQDGLNAMDLTGDFNQGLESGIAQTISTVPGTRYELSFQVGRASGNSPAYGSASTVDVSIDGGPRVSFTNSNATPGSVHWQQFKTTFVAAGPATVLQFFNGQANNRYTGLDNVSVSAVSAVDASLIGHWVADDLPLGDSGSWRSRVNSVVAPVDRGSPQVGNGSGFNGHRYVTMNPSHPGDTSTADTFYVPSSSAAHPTGPFTVTVVFRMPVTATGSGSPAGNIWYESAGLVGMEVAGSPNPPDWILGIDGLNHLSVFATRGTSVVNTGRVVIATAVYSEEGVSIYRNGVLEGQTPGAWTTTWNAALLAFGANRAASNRGGTGFPETFFTGDIAEIRIHGAAVDAQREFAALRDTYLPEPQITGFEIVAGTPRISFTTIESGSYRVEWNNTLTQPSWTAVTGANSISGNGGIVQVADTEAAAGNLPRRFYRVLFLH